MLFEIVVCAYIYYSGSQPEEIPFQGMFFYIGDEITRTFSSYSYENIILIVFVENKNKYINTY